MAKKKSAGKKAKKKKKSSSGGSTVLIDDLKKEITDALTYWQLNLGKDVIRQKLADMVNPNKFDTSLITLMIARTQNYHALIKDAKDNGEVSPMVIPLMAAIGFEGVFHSCAGFWLVSGDPPAPGTLKKSVEDFVDMQVKAFGACLGI